MNRQNGIMTVALAGLVGLGSYAGVQLKKKDADAHKLIDPCPVDERCGRHDIRIRRPGFGRAILSLTASDALLLPIAVLTGRYGRASIGAGLLAATSLSLALALRADYVRVDDERRTADNGKSGMKVLGSIDILMFAYALIGPDDGDDDADDGVDRNGAWLDEPLARTA